MSNTQNSTIEERALQLLGNGITPDVVASALGITPSRVSQLTSQDEFAAKLVELRYENLSRHNVRDNKYDTLEDELILKLDQTKDLMFRPEQILRALQVINGAKRRGASTPEAITNQQPVVQITMPVKVINKFTTNINNQVITAGEQTLVTVQSGSLLEKLKESQAKALESRTFEANHGYGRIEAIRSAEIPDGPKQTTRSADLGINQTPAFATSE